MKNKKSITLLLPGLLLGCLAYHGAVSALPEPSMMAMGAASSSESPSEPNNAAYATEDSEDYAQEKAALLEKLKLYEPFGMTYDADKDELQFHGKLVRWFEDYYPLSDENEAGYDHFDENGVVDVYAVRDFSSLTHHDDGSYDPSGKVVALKEFSDKEFADRDIDAIKNSTANQECAVEGEPLTKQEAEKIAAEYAAFGVTYNYSSDQWYLNGEKIRYFLDILTSNNKDLSSGDFQGSIRSSWNDNGTIDVYTVRDFNKLNDDKNGTLTNIKKYSQQEFDEHTRSNS